MILPLAPVRAANFNIANGDIAALRSAIFQANSNNQDDTINLASGASYVFSAAYIAANEDGDTALPAIGSDQGRQVTINGNNSTLSRSAGLIRFINIGLSSNVSVSNVTFSGGSLSLSNSQFDLGGAIRNAGALVLNNCTFDGNSARSGGGVYNGGSLQMKGCTFVGNTSSLSISGVGGALYSNGVSVLSHCTFSENHSLDGDNISNGSELTLIHCTFNGGTISCVNQTILNKITVGNSIFAAGARFVDLNNSDLFVSSGYNLTSSSSSVFDHPKDLVGSSYKPGLDPEGLKFNGGPTRTFRLMADSSAIDQGNAFGSTLDQRGFPRSVNNPSFPNSSDGTDVGAFESGSDAPQSGVGGFVVNTLTDTNDGVPGGTHCSLREALQQANAASTPATVRFSPELNGTITLTGAGGGMLSILKGVEIKGPGARRIRVNGNANYRVLGISGAGTTRISGLTIAGGLISAPSGQSGEGGGIYNSGTLEVLDCTFDFNRATGGSGSTLGQVGGSGRGGAVFNAGTLTLDGCTLINNGATGAFGANNPPPDSFTLTNGGAGGSGLGGGVHNSSGGTLTVVNCTFSANSAVGSSGGSGSWGGAGGSGLGGAIYNLGTVVLKSSTIAGNTTFSGSGGAGRSSFFNGPVGSAAGGLSTAGGIATVVNTIAAGNSASGAFNQDINGTFFSSGFNLIGKVEGGSGFTSMGDRTGSNSAPLSAQLSPLGNNGGHTDTFRPLSGSPAIDQGNGAGVLLDQRGRGRSRDLSALVNAANGDGSDIGAFEIEGGIIVSSELDTSDGLVDRNETTLREAITLANTEGTVSDPALITFKTNMNILLLSELPPLARSMSITGPSEGQLSVSRSTNASEFRIFTISDNTPAGPVVRISRLLISGGIVSSGSFPLNCGGAILSRYGSLSLEDCRVFSNSSPSLLGTGGGVFNYGGSLTVNRCTISSNTAFIGGGIGSHQPGIGAATTSITNCTFIANVAQGGDGGALNNEGDGGNAVMTVTQCTISHNRSSGGSGGRGAVLVNRGGGGGNASVTMARCTVDSNVPAAAAGILNHASGGSATLTIGNTILSRRNSLLPNLENSGGTIVSAGYNLCDDSAGGGDGTDPNGYLNGTGDIRNRPANLGPLEENGGATATHLPLAGSPAIDGGSGSSSATDQRGVVRPIDSPYYDNPSGGDGTDIGAVEVRPTGVSTDRNSDGIPDEWAIYHNTTLANDDPDLDGRTNLQEFGSGTDPQVSPFRIVGIEISGANVLMTFTGIASRSVALERSTSLAPGSWLPTGVQITPLTTGLTPIDHLSGVSGPKAFYRVRGLP